MKSIAKIFFMLLLLFGNTQAREEVNVSFSDLAIKDFIALVAKITGKNILVNYPISGNINFISSAPIYDDEVIDILISVLQTKGYTLADNGSFYSVVRSNEAAKHTVKVVTDPKRLSGNLMLTYTMPIHYENVDVIAAKIRYLISKTAKLMTLKESNTLLITDYPKNIKTIKKVISELDQPRKLSVDVIHIENTEAKKLQSKLDAINKSIFNPKVLQEPVKILVDEALNSIILVGKKENVAKIKSILSKLDKEANASNSVRIFPLKNSDAKAVAKSLNDIISKQKFKDPTLKPNVSESDEINAIIAVGDPIILNGIKKIIDELDKEKYQVYVQANIIEINRNNAKNLGIKYGFNGASLGSQGGLYTLSANFGGAPILGLGDIISKMDAENISTVFALNAAIDFLKTNGVAKSISNPSILCVNNKESSIYVGKTISVVSGSVANNTGGVGTGITTTYKREDVGLTLKIKPRVSSKDKVTLNVEATLENIIDDGTNNATRQPVTSKQNVKTEAILRHGESIIIGGLVKSYKQKTKTKVPLLGDIPWIGEWLFSSTEERVEDDNLVVVLTPYVIDKSEQLSKLQKELGELSKIQEEYEKRVFARFQKKQQDGSSKEGIDISKKIIEEE
ncbi:General secretion pathway protein D / Type II secretion outermembrane pore forming protein (PulD) [hydrothermal vent metagenome]|uniref:General secretion pathway protein D / Type II secretion outermembrane pore forming protein (PulD) n=1 Tax=hydrothermal vent metagenome TaxID=652676 RepID=A0A1W1BKH1_9ZZZZ